MGRAVVKELMLLRAFRPRPFALDVMKIDIDSADCWLVHHLLQHVPLLRPKVIIAEAHPLPPPFKFSLWDSGDNPSTLSQAGGGDHGLDARYRQRLNLGVYGCSLSSWVSFLWPFGYRLLSFLHKDVSFVHESVIRQAFPEVEGGSSEFACYEAATPHSSGFTPAQLRSWFYSGDIYGSLRAVQHELNHRSQLLSELTNQTPMFMLTL